MVTYGPYLYFTPGIGGRFVRHDTRLGFKNPQAWNVNMIKVVDATETGEFYGALRKGRHIYFAPAGGFAVIRFSPEGPEPDPDE
jgi:hypothetical protein